MDIGAPLLRFAHARARALGYEVHYSQQDARQLDFEDGQFDLIVSSFFLHEQSKATNRKVLKEAHRLLRPGGIMVHMELPPAGEVDPYYNFYLDWDAYYNNEPHYAGFRELDPVDECVRAGFERGRCFARRIPNYGIVSDAEFADSALGRRPAPQHGNGASWFIFGAGRYEGHSCGVAFGRRGHHASRHAAVADQAHVDAGGQQGCLEARRGNAGRRVGEQRGVRHEMQLARVDAGKRNRAVLQSRFGGQLVKRQYLDAEGVPFADGCRARSRVARRPRSVPAESPRPHARTASRAVR